MKKCSKVMWMIGARVVVVLPLMLVLGCAGNINVTAPASIPQPLVESYPLTVGIYYSPELLEYAYEQKIADLGTIKIDIGTSQKGVFDRLYGSLFQEVVQVESLESVPANVAGVLVPSLEDVQLMTPRQSRGDYYEVWMKYDIQLIEPNSSPEDDPIYIWRLNVGGKANRHDYSKFNERANVALAEAVRNAYRDLATLVVINLQATTRRPLPRKLNDWLQEHAEE